MPGSPRHRQWFCPQGKGDAYESRVVHVHPMGDGGVLHSLRYGDIVECANSAQLSDSPDSLRGSDLERFFRLGGVASVLW